MKIPTDAEKRDIFDRLNKRIVYRALKLNAKAEDFKSFTAELFDEYYEICHEYPQSCYRWMIKALYKNTLDIRNIALDKYNRGEDITARIEEYISFDSSEIVF